MVEMESSFFSIDIYRVCVRKSDVFKIVVEIFNGGETRRIS